MAGNWLVVAKVICGGVTVTLGGGAVPVLILMQPMMTNLLVLLGVPLLMQPTKLLVDSVVEESLGLGPTIDSSTSEASVVLCLRA